MTDCHNLLRLAATGYYYGHSPGKPLDPGYARMNDFTFSCLTRHS
jgi:hypothetical protein